MHTLQVNFSLVLSPRANKFSFTRAPQTRLSARNKRWEGRAFSQNFRKTTLGHKM